MNGCNQYWQIVKEARKVSDDRVFLQLMNSARNHQTVCLKCAFGELNDESNPDSRTKRSDPQPA